MHKHSYVCLSCQMKTGRLFVHSKHFQNVPISRRAISSSAFKNSGQITQDAQQSSDAEGNSAIEIENSSLIPAHYIDYSSRQSRDKQWRNNSLQSNNVAPSIHTNPHGDFYRPLISSRKASASHAPQTRNASLSPPIMLSKAQQEELTAVYNLRQKLTNGLQREPNSKKISPGADGVPINDALKALSTDDCSPAQEKLIHRLQTEYSGSSVRDVLYDLNSAATYRNPLANKVKSPEAKEILTKLGVVERRSRTMKPSPSGQIVNSDLRSSSSKGAAAPTGQRRPSLASMVTPSKTAFKPLASPMPDTSSTMPPFPTKAKRKPNQKTVNGQDLVLASVNSSLPGELPRLSHDLSRVLFNPGVYQLQDPRSRVYNFSPYLAKPMPASEFNFEALNPYLTSSEDPQLLQLAQSLESRYIGSSSSMTSVLAHFHYLISQWREINMSNFTRGLSENAKNFTAIHRAPAAIFLRYRDGVYAVDADKEFDEPNVLMSLGKAMEKLLTLEEADFEKWRKSNTSGGGIPGDQPEMFHYSRQGQFLLRSQLDACDKRLPGKGYFDLKTRAVAGIRQQMRDVESGMGYQIKERNGSWESYEREYYDMVRSTMLKYSLQVRMGSMDGIFVAYHNISRIFGFQYIPISEMDLALHGQEDPCLGDQEFRFSINFMEEIFNIATAKFPRQSIRIYFETREPTAIDPTLRMEIFIEAMEEDQIEQLQASQKAHFDEFEKKMLRGDETEAVELVKEELENEVGEEVPDSTAAVKEEDAPLPANTFKTKIQGAATTAADKDFLDKMLGSKAAKLPISTEDKLLGLKLTVQNKINDKNVVRPDSIASGTRWSIDYSLEELPSETVAKMYRTCKVRRKTVLTSSINRENDNYFLRTVKTLSEEGAKWRKEQDELDAQREPVMLYETRRLDKD